MGWPFWLLIIWAFVIGLLISVTWTIYQFLRLNACETEKDIWCSDKWTCNVPCPHDPDRISCFEQTTNIASCIYDFLITDETSVRCRDGSTAGPDGITCACPTEGTDTNCMSGCPMNLDSAPSSCCISDNVKAHPDQYPLCQFTPDN
jgi:hypothetical protein